MSRRRSIVFNFALLMLYFNTFAQEGKKPLTLEEVTQWAVSHSLESLKSRHSYQYSFWKYKSFKAQFLPEVTLDAQPFNYNRAFVKRYDSENNIDVYREQQNLNTSTQLNIRQNIISTGTQFFVSSNFARLTNYGEETITNFNVSPISIGIFQPLFVHNELKWEDQLIEIENKAIEKKFLQERQQIEMDVYTLFFEWALAAVRFEIATENQANYKRLYEIGKKRYQIGAIERDDLLNLELEEFTSRADLNRVEQELNVAISELNVYLISKDVSGYTPVLPGTIEGLQIDLEQAKAFMIENNPEILNLELKKVNADKNYDKVKKDNNFDLSLTASYGLNQQGTTLATATNDFLDQQIFFVQLTIPILDWGRRKGLLKMAQMEREIADLEISKEKNDIYNSLSVAVKNFNLQQQQVEAAYRSKNISKESYEVTEKRFISGNVDLLRLTSSRAAWQNASEQYLIQLRTYWDYYLLVKKFTLYDFVNNQKLREDFSRIIQ